MAQNERIPAPTDIALLRELVESAWFKRVVLATIVAGAVLIGLQTDRALVEAQRPLLHLIDLAIIAIFALEAVLKIASYGSKWWRYFFDPWNVFDFVIVVVCLLPVQSQFAAVFRLARVLRSLRLVTALPRLQLLVGSLLRSVPSMVYIGLLLFILFYVYAVTGVFLFRGNDPVHFGDLPSAMLTLFRVVTLEDWTDVMYLQMLGSDRYPFAFEGVTPENPKAMPIVGAGFFVSFVLLGTMIMLNLFIGVIINSMNEAHEEQERRIRMRHLRETGTTTLEDEITVIERDLIELTRRLHLLRKSPEADASVPDTGNGDGVEQPQTAER